MRFSILTVLVVLLSYTMPAQAKLYKWVDENGQVHFGDRIPPQYRKKEHQEINERGRTLKKVDAMETEDEMKARKEKEKADKEKKKLAEEQRKRDRVLLDTYTTERDLVAARDSRVVAVDSQIKLSQEIIDDATKKLAQTETVISNIEKSGRKVPENTLKKKEREEKQLETYKKVQEGHKEKRADIIKQFDAYIARFRELMADKKARREAKK